MTNPRLPYEALEGKRDFAMEDIRPLMLAHYSLEFRLGVRTARKDMTPAAKLYRMWQAMNYRDSQGTKPVPLFRVRTEYAYRYLGCRSRDEYYDKLWISDSKIAEALNDDRDLVKLVPPRQEDQRLAA